MHPKFLTLLVLSMPLLASASGKQVLQEHLPAAIFKLQPVHSLSPTNQLDLAIGLPLRNQDGLAHFLKDLYDPGSTAYHRYLNADQFTEKFGPTAENYEAAKAFALARGLRIVGTHANRVLLDVRGTVADIENAFHVNMRVYQHPTEARTFFAPDTEPSINLEVPVLHISGLNNYTVPHPRSLRRTPLNASAVPRAGSGQGGAYMGKDFRKAYVPDVSLTGAGQTLGLLELDGYYASDVAAYAQQAGLEAVPLQVVLVDGFKGVPVGRGSGSGNEEVALDIEMAMSMAPGLKKILVYETSPTSTTANINDVLNRMATDNQAQQLSCSWGFDIDATSQQIFQQYAAQGQSFFMASGDNGAFSGAVFQPSDDPYIIVVGGTTLRTGSSGGWVSETTWSGSGGGISTIYPIPAWQQGIDMSASKGSSTMRNLPDVAMVADNVIDMADLGKSFSVVGTSIAAPLWAGFTALVNEQASNEGKPPVGFINPAIYQLGKETNYAQLFHDVASGNNTSATSPNRFYAVRGYDLCTGWGTPAGSNLIHALLAPPTNNLWITPPLGFTAMGALGGPYNVTSSTYLLHNGGTSPLNWSAGKDSAWLDVSPSFGALPLDGPDTNVLISLNPTADTLPLGTYTANVWFTNLMNHTVQSRQFTLLAGNSSFETGDFAQWTLSGDSFTSYAVSLDASQFTGVTKIPGVDDANFVHSGIYGAFLGQKDTLGSLSQNIITIPGQRYLLSFWLANPKAGTPNEFRVLWHTNTLFDKINLGRLNWTNLHYMVTATNELTTLQFDFRNDNSAFALDDISLQIIGAPVLQNVAINNRLLTFTLSLVAGQKYQVQYSADLNSTIWNNLGAPVIATHDTSTISDIAGQDGQQFYRVALLP